MLYKQERAELGIFSVPRWNFFKYLIGRDGHIVAWYSSTTTPSSDALAEKIEAELAKKP